MSIIEISLVLTFTYASLNLIFIFRAKIFHFISSYLILSSSIPSYFILLDKIAKSMRFTKKAEESEMDRDVRRSWTAFLKDCYEADLEVIRQKIILILIFLYRKNSELKNNFEDSYKHKKSFWKFSKVSHFIKIIEDYFFLFSLLFIIIFFFFRPHSFLSFRQFFIFFNSLLPSCQLMKYH